MTTEERDRLRAIRSNRFWFRLALLGGLALCFFVHRATDSDAMLVAVVAGWLIATFYFARLAVGSRCPRCGGYFFSSGARPFPAKLRARGCVRCGMPLAADRVIYPSME